MEISGGPEYDWLVEFSTVGHRRVGSAKCTNLDYVYRKAHDGMKSKL